MGNLIKNSKNTIVISGGASGIGLAAVKKFLIEGFNVCVLDHNQKALDQLSQELDNYKTNLFVNVCDITDSEKVALAMDECLDRFGSINAVLPAAGIVKDHYFIKTDRNSVLKFVVLKK